MAQKHTNPSLHDEIRTGKGCMNYSELIALVCSTQNPSSLFVSKSQI
jgi:hypothetical protein